MRETRLLPAPDLSVRANVEAYDEAPLWSAGFGSLLLEHVPLRPGIRALDVGCGAGFPLLELAGRLGSGSVVHGVDVWQAALFRGARKARAMGVTQSLLLAANAVSLPYRDATFDLVVSNLGLNNFADASGAMRECARVMKSGATLAFTTNLSGHMRELYEVMRDVLTSRGERALARLKTHVEARATIERIRTLLSDAALDVVTIIHDEVIMRFADGTALFGHYFIRLGFVDGWLAIVEAEHQRDVFGELEKQLNERAQREGCLTLTIPRAYVEARKS